MKKKGRRLFLKICILTFSLFLIALTSLFVFFFSITKDAKLNVDALRSGDSAQVQMFYNSGEKMPPLSQPSLDIKKINPYTVNAFIATEDKRFFSHHGVDFKRIVGAALNNLKSGKFIEGGSTISQQLIKNTHLSREKTIKRKAKEIKLALSLEKKYSKEEILSMYLSTIYFGNGCWGLTSAAEFYFNKEPSELTLNESALLASVINAPSYYDLLTAKERVEKRKKLILKNMLSCGYITEDEFNKNANFVQKIEKTASKRQFVEQKAVLSEAAKILNMSENELKNKNYSIFTSLDSSLENSLKNILNDFSSGVLEPYEVSIIVIDNAQKSVVSYASNSASSLSRKRQPGSTIKPILVYAPAFERGLIYPSSTILDEPININGYSPSNANKTYLGLVSVSDAIKKSLNIPAVKTLSNLGINNAKEFARGLGIEFDKGDQNLALALGGMTKGVTLSQLADAYSAFSTEGVYKKSSPISKIVDDKGKVIYTDSSPKSQAMSRSTAYLITDTLKEVTLSGTARRLAPLNLPLASKTGTVGMTGSKENLDAYMVSYSKEYTVAARISALTTPLNESINGSNYPAEIVKRAFEVLYKGRQCPDFSMPSEVTKVDIDTRSLINGKFELANIMSPPKFKKEVFIPLSDVKNLNYYTCEPLTLDVTLEENSKPILTYSAKEGYIYELYRKNIKSGEEEIIETFSGLDTKHSYIDNCAISGEIYEYWLSSGEQISNSIKLMSY